MPSGGEKHEAKTKSSFRIFCNLFIAFVGAGILGLPFAFKEAGLVEGCVIMLAVGFISSKAMILLINCKEKILSSNDYHQLSAKGSGSPTRLPPEKRLASPFKSLVKNVLIDKKQREEDVSSPLTSDDEKSDESDAIPPPLALYPKTIMYGDVGFYALGTLGKMLVEVALVISQAGFCCSYLIYISETLSSLTPFSRIQILLLAMPLLMVMALIKDLHSMAVFSFFAQFANLSAFAVVFWFDFEHYGRVKFEPKSTSLSSVPFFMAVGIYCYEGAGMILSIEDSVACSHRAKFRRLFVVTMVLVTLLYVSFGVAGFLSYGLETSPIITTNLPHGTGSSVDFAIVVKLLLCFALLFTYPVMLFPVVKLVEANLEERILVLLLSLRLVREIESCMLSRSLIRVSVVLLTNLVVVLIPNFANLMALVGASCCTLLAFILPGIFHFQLFRNSGIGRSQIWFDVFLIILGIVGASLGTADALNRIRTPLPTPQPNSLDNFPASSSAESLASPSSPAAVAAAAAVATSNAHISDTPAATDSFRSGLGVTSGEGLTSSTATWILSLSRSLTTNIPKVIEDMFNSKATN